MSYSARLLLVVGGLIIVFGIILNGLLLDSFWIDEAYSASIIHDDMRDPNGIRETVRYVRDSVFTVFDRVQSDVHPPLYYLLLDAWALLVGRSEFALRLPSALMALVALSATYAIGRSWFNAKTGILALLVLGTLGFYLYYAREARMYGLYLALVTLSTWAYSQWWHKQTIFRVIIYAITTTLLLYTHYTSFTLLIVHGLHAVLTVKHWFSGHNLLYLLVMWVMPLLAFARWMPILLEQFEINTQGIASGALPSDLATLAAIGLVLTSGYWGVFALVAIFSRNTLKLGQHLSAMMLLLLWANVPIITLFVINAYGIAVLQLRYLIPILPVWALLIGYLLADMRVPLVNNRWLTIAVTVFFVAWVGYTQLATYHLFWKAKPDWRGAVVNTADARNPLDPALVYTHPTSPIRYYDEFYGMLDGISIRLDWRSFTSAEVREITSTVQSSERLWAITEMQAPESWDILSALSQNHGVAYRDSVQGAIFYQFDRQSDDELSFSFGTSSNDIIFDYQAYQYAQTLITDDAEICQYIALNPRSDNASNYTLTLSLTRGYNEVIASTQQTVTTESDIQEILCLPMPVPDNYHLRLQIHDATGQTLFLLENGEYWGDYLMLGTLE